MQGFWYFVSFIISRMRYITLFYCSLQSKARYVIFSRADSFRTLLWLTKEGTQEYKSTHIPPSLKSLARGVYVAWNFIFELFSFVNQNCTSQRSGDSSHEYFSVTSENESPQKTTQGAYTMGSYCPILWCSKIVWSHWLCWADECHVIVQWPLIGGMLFAFHFLLCFGAHEEARSTFLSYFHGKTPLVSLLESMKGLIRSLML